MCTPSICPCPKEADVVKVWGSIPEANLRKYGRIANEGQYTADERAAIIAKGPYDAEVIVFDYADTGAVRNYK
jgi:hypothetical protein